MDDYRDEFQRLLESLYIPTVGDRTKIEKELNAFLAQIANSKAVPAWTFEKDFELLKIIDQIEA